MDGGGAWRSKCKACRGALLYELGSGAGSVILECNEIGESFPKTQFSAQISEETVFYNETWPQLRLY